MATDQFGNELTEEELYRLMIQQQRMGLQPGPVDTFANMPATPPSIDYNQVMEDWSDPGILSAPAFDAPRPATTASVTPTWDTGAVSGVPQTAMTRHERSKLQLPIGAFTPLPDFNVPAFTPVGPTQEVPARIRQTIPTANDPTGGLSATDPNLQGVTPMSMASTGLSPQAGAYEKTAHGIGTGIMDAFGIDTQQHMDNVGMINKLSQSDMLDVPTGWNNEMYAAGLKAQDFVQSGANPLLAMAGSYPYQGLTEAFRATVDPTISYEEAMRMAAVQGLGGMIGAAGGLPAFEGPIGELIDDTVEKNVLGITTPDVTPNMWDTSAVSSVSPTLPSYGVATGLTKQEMLDAGWKESTTGGLFPWPMSQEQMQDPDRVADMEVDTQVDTFSAGFPTGAVSTGSGGGFRPGFASQRDTYAPTDIPAAPAKPAGPTRAELKAAAAAQRKADLAEQKAAARRTALARQALKDSQAAAARAQAASEKQAKAAQAKARALLDRAASSDHSPYSEAEINAAREVLSQIDTFDSGGMRGDRNGGAAGALGGYRGDPVGRAAAIESRGGSRNGGGRDHGGGYHGR